MNSGMYSCTVILLVEFPTPINQYGKISTICTERSPWYHATEVLSKGSGWNYIYVGSKITYQSVEWWLHIAEGHFVFVKILWEFDFTVIFTEASKWENRQ